jgi:nucleoid DNA-binding protein
LVRHSIELPGLGVFGTKEKPERPGVNPISGEQITVAARRIVFFKADPSLNERITHARLKSG